MTTALELPTGLVVRQWQALLLLLGPVLAAGEREGRRVRGARPVLARGASDAIYAKPRDIHVYMATPC